MSNKAPYLSIFAIGLLLIGGCTRNEEPRLLLYCGAGLRPPVAELVDLFNAREGVKIECYYAGSEMLLSQVKLTHRGDLLMPGDASYIDMAAEGGLIRSSRGVCELVPVIMVRKGNPKKIGKLADLGQSGLRLGVGDPKVCAVGAVSAKLIEKCRPATEAINRNVVYRAQTVHELGNHVKLGSVDAAIVWDSVAKAYADAEAIAIEPELGAISKVAIAVLQSSERPGLAARFAAFVGSKEAAAVFEKHGYKTR